MDDKILKTSEELHYRVKMAAVKNKVTVRQLTTKLLEHGLNQLRVKNISVGEEDAK